jgi:predicted PurR-regulated permease PerM
LPATGCLLRCARTIPLAVSERAIKLRAGVNEPKRISFVFILAAFILTGWLHLGVLLLSILFSYFALTHLDFFKGRRKWPAITVFLAFLAGLAYGLAFFIRATATALPGIAEKSVPAIIQWGADHHIELPFTDYESLKDRILKTAANEARNIGMFADFARGATTQFVYLLAGCAVAMGLFLNPRLELEGPSGADRNNLYSHTCAEIGHRFAAFYRSFAVVMKAQVIIAAIDATLTGIFLTVTGLPHLVVAVGVTFLCGLLPVVGNLLSNTLIVAIGFTVSPAKGLGALVFLVCIHQLEYFLNSRIIGGKIESPLWLTLLALVLGESLMGVTGMILAPAVLHYIRIEASAVSLVNHKQC